MPSRFLLHGYEGMTQREKSIRPQGKVRLPEALGSLAMAAAGYGGHASGMIPIIESKVAGERLIHRKRIRKKSSRGAGSIFKATDAE